MIRQTWKSTWPAVVLLVLAAQASRAELLAGPGTYLPTRKAIRGGHYSAVVHSSLVGAEGGQILVDRTVSLINSIL